ncbi:pyridoxal phosphate-dependent transferase [Fimicolochytrium jonesii]|uniref:pyridoxal phosphate-dependent transferase n=1 Tax=Fimicolochytrium jonesii TaxID=1396493 RepID=UPI0022FEB484|nr:pyridoxal phosphate-dependent transferase [Fimicolochytrium jonesii]KAI8824289.1 pyridoxal phosphate-dependent transferase [Fimicolochytrium jonesii]
MSTLGSYAGPFVNDAARDLADSLVVTVNSTIALASNMYSAIPGSRILALYVKSSYQNDPYRTLLEIGLVIFLIWYFGGKKYKPGKQHEKIILTEKEIQELIDEWEPEPLVVPPTEAQRLELEKIPIISGPSGPKVKLADGKEKLNLASFNFLGAMNQESTKEKAIAAVRKYGVGTCGPCGFYGTIDVHIDLEKEVSRFIGVEDAIVYSQGFSTIGSVIPAFSKRGDIIVADSGVNFAVQKGIQVSRSVVKYFKHNDMEDLERVLKQVQQESLKKKKPLTRQFIVVEGLYVNHGDICPLPKLIELRNKYKYRLIVEESMSLGVLGPRGAGVCDHYGISPKDVDMITASMANTLGAGGGFCCGSKEIVEHQRLSGQGYVFSASLPALLAVSAMEGIKHVEAHPELVTRLQENSVLMRQTIRKGVQRVECSGPDESPVLHVRLSDLLDQPVDEQEKALQEVVEEAMRNGVLITRAKYVHGQELNVPSPSIRIAVSASHSRKEVEKSGSVVAAAIKKVLKSRR